MEAPPPCPPRHGSPARYRRPRRRDWAETGEKLRGGPGWLPFARSHVALHGPVRPLAACVVRLLSAGLSLAVRWRGVGLPPGLAGSWVPAAARGPAGRWRRRLPVAGAAPGEGAAGPGQRWGGRGLRPVSKRRGLAGGAAGRAAG